MKLPKPDLEKSKKEFKSRMEKRREFEKKLDKDKKVTKKILDLEFTHQQRGEEK